MKITAAGIKKDFIRKGKGTNIFTAVKPCDITLEAGVLTVIRGRSGSGKSTLLTVLAGLLTPTEGSVLYDKTDMYALSDEKRSDFRGSHIGVIAQGKSAVGSLSVMENILLPFLLGTKNGEASAQDALQLMEKFGILHLKDAMPRELSGGELRRTAIARALITKPDVLFADEPTSDLDDENTKIVLSALKEAADDGAAVLLVTHEAGAETMADMRYHMDAGELIRD